MKWKTREGKEINVSDMTPSHAENCILMLIRNNGPRIVLESILYAHEKYSEKSIRADEVILNGDMAQDFNDMMDDSFDDYPMDPYWDDHKL